MSHRWTCTYFIRDCVTALFGSIDHANSVTLEQRVKEVHLIVDPSRLPVAWQKLSVEFTSAQWAVSPSSCEGQRRCLLRRKNMLSMQYCTVVINNWRHNSTLHEFQTNLCDETYTTDLLSRYDAELVTRSKCNVYNMVLAKHKINLKGSNQVTVYWKNLLSCRSGSWRTIMLQLCISRTTHTPPHISVTQGHSLLLGAIGFSSK